MLPSIPGEPYLGLLDAALARQGVQRGPVAAGRRLTPTWAWRTRKRIHAVHLHWLEWLLGSPGEPTLKRFVNHYLNALLLVTALGLLRRSGVRIVWTVHNLRPHEPRFPLLEGALSRAVARLAHDVVLHSRYAGMRFGESHRTKARIHIVPLPHYIGVYPDGRQTGVEAKRLLGIPEESFTYLIFGQIRAYKQVPVAIRAFRELDDARVHLVIAGRPYPSQDAAVFEAIGDDPRVTYHGRAIPDEEVAIYHRAADAAILCYRDVFSSAALLLALSFGIPVVVPARSTATEMAPGLASAAFEEGDVRAALLAIREGDQADRRNAAITAARANSWDDTARRLADIYSHR